MAELIYQHIDPIDKAEAVAELDTGDSERIILALLRSAYHIGDWRWVQNICLYSLSNPDPGVKRIAALCFSHIARIHGVLETERVKPALDPLRDDPEIGEEVEEILEEIDWFLKEK